MKFFGCSNDNEKTYEVSDPSVARPRIAHKSPSCQSANLWVKCLIIKCHYYSIIPSLTLANLVTKFLQFGSSGQNLCSGPPSAQATSLPSLRPPIRPRTHLPPTRSLGVSAPPLRSTQSKAESPNRTKPALDPPDYSTGTMGMKRYLIEWWWWNTFSSLLFSREMRRDHDLIMDLEWYLDGA